MKEDIQFVEAYFKDLRDIYQTSGLSNLLNGIGKKLKPQVKCIIQYSNRGAAHPDGGLFTKEQWDLGNVYLSLMGQVPCVV